MADTLGSISKAYLIKRILDYHAPRDASGSWSELCYICLDGLWLILYRMVFPFLLWVTAPSRLSAPRYPLAPYDPLGYGVPLSLVRLDIKNEKGRPGKINVHERMFSDNSACEGFFGRLKNEMLYNRSWQDVSIEQFVNMLNLYIRWYNEKHIKVSLGAMSPMDYRGSLGWVA